MLKIGVIALRHLPTLLNVDVDVDVKIVLAQPAKAYCTWSPRIRETTRISKVRNCRFCKKGKRPVDAITHQLSNRPANGLIYCR